MNIFAKRKFLVALLVFVFLSAISIDGWFLLKQSSTLQLSNQFQSETSQITSLVNTRLDLYTNVLYGIEGLYSASQQLQANEFSDYVQRLDIPDNYAGITSMAFIQKVTADATSTYPYKIFPYTNKNIYYPVTYLVSTASTTGVLGYDISSDPTRFAGISKSLKTGLPTASGVVLTITTHAPSFSIYAPVYPEGEMPSTVADRTNDLTGFVSVGFHLDTLFNSLASNPVFDKNIHVEIYDAPELAQASSSTLLYDSDKTLVGTTHPALNSFSQATHIIVGGRAWTIYYSALPTFYSNSLQSYVPIVATTVSVGASLLIAWLFYLFASSRERAERIAEQITSELKESQQLLKISMENAADMIFTMNDSGDYVDVNQMACDTLGYTKEELLKMNASKIFASQRNEDIAMLFDTLREKKNVDSEVQFRKKDGTVFPVEVRTSMFGDDPLHPYAISIVRDISERKEADQKLQERTAEIERTNKLMVDRELAMIELKKKLAESVEKNNHGT